MKKTLLLTIIAHFAFLIANAQAPNKMTYQAMVRNTDGTVVSVAGVGIRLSILQNSNFGTAVYVETHFKQTNPNGLFKANIGEGNVSLGNFSTIDWSTGIYYLKSETDPSGGTNYIYSSVTQMMSVPYALYAQTAANGDKIVNLTGLGNIGVSGIYPNFSISGTGGTTYTSGSGITINGLNQIVNTSPDKIVSILGIGGTLVTGVYPNFSISGIGGTTYTSGSGISITGSNQIVNLWPQLSISGFGGTTITGTYPNLNIFSPSSLGTSAGVNYSAGNGVSISGTNQIVNTLPNQAVTLTGFGGTTITGTYPNFSIASPANLGTSSGINYSAGSGISINGLNVIANTSPNIPVTLLGINGITIAGSNNRFSVTGSNLVSQQYTSVTGIGVTIFGSGTLAQTILGQNYTAGNGISISGTNQIVNTYSNQTVTLTGFGGTTVTGTYPSFSIASPANLGTSSGINYSAGLGISINGLNVIANTSPNIPVTLLGINGITIAGSNNRFSVTGSNLVSQQYTSVTGIGVTIFGSGALAQTILGQNLTAGNGISISGTNQIVNTFNSGQQVSITGIGTINVTGVFPNFTINGTSQWVNNGSNIFFSTGKVGLGTNVPNQSLAVVGNTSVTGIGYFGTLIGNNLAGAAGSVLTVDAIGKLGIGTLPIGSQWISQSTNQIYTNSFVGINFSTPGAALDVVGNVTLAGQPNVGVRFRSSTLATSDAGVMIGVTNGNTPFIADDPGGGTSIGLTFNTNNVERIRINTAGNVGIGTITPNQKLSINGGLGFANNNDADKKVYSPTDGTLEWMTNNAATEHGFAISNQGTKVVYLNTNGNSYLNGGNVGIGTATPNTDAILHLYDSNGATSGTSGVFLDIQNSSNVTNNLTGIRFTGSSASTYLKTAILVPYTNGSWGVSDMIFALNGVSNNTIVSTSDAKMIIKSTGNVGIGTTLYSTSPQVHIYSNPSSTALVENLRLTAGNCSTGGGPMLTFQNACGGSTDTFYQDWITAAIGSPYSGSYQGDLTFYTNNGAATTGSIGVSTYERMRIKSNGYVGIGTNNPQYPLDVQISTSGGSYSYYYGPSGQSSSPGGSGASTSANFSLDVRAYAFLAWSDKRIKENIVLSDAKSDLERVMTLQVRDYTHIDKVKRGTESHKGFIAQEVKEVFPEAVIINKVKEFIPSIYSNATSVNKIVDANYSICTKSKHDLAKGDTVRLITFKNTIETQVIDIQNNQCFIVNSPDIYSDSIFVYGKAVKDFHTVDYDRIYTLGISAMQELFRILEAEKAKNTVLRQEINDLKLQLDKVSTETKAELEHIKKYLGVDIEAKR